MTSIGGFVDGILDGTVPKEKERHYLEIISSEIRRLNRLVSRMLDITRLQAADYPQNLTKFDFCEVIRRAVFGFEKRIEEKSINIDISLSEYTIEVNANEDAIYQVIYNLIDNAIKFTANNETIVIKANSSGGKAEFKIINRGASIPEEQIPYIFDRFHKTDRSRSADKSGLGLGLYIAKMIVSQHKGEMGVKSLDGVTEFRFTIPIEPPKSRQ
jgi:signal transduction histidine kinase